MVQVQMTSFPLSTGKEQAMLCQISYLGSNDKRRSLHWSVYVGIYSIKKYEIKTEYLLLHLFFPFEERWNIREKVH